MKIELKEITIQELSIGYQDNNENCPFIALLNDGTTECFEYCKIKKQQNEAN